MGRPNLSPIEEMLKKRSEIILTEEQYAAKTGEPLPQENSYLRRASAIAKLCKREGFAMEVVKAQPRKIIIRKEK